MNIHNVLRVMEKEGKYAEVYILSSLIKNPLDALICALLSTRTKDKKTIEVCKVLLKRIKKIEDLRQISIDELTKLIYGVGFYKRKAVYLKQIAEKINDNFNLSDEYLMSLPGVGRKVAHIVRLYANIDEIAVDIHVHRISNRLGIVNTKTPIQTEIELKKIIPKQYWRKVNIVFVSYGQTICKAKPKCDICKLKHVCKYYNTFKDQD